MEVLLNWLWQGCLVGLSAAVMLRVLHRSPANTRYLVCCVALAGVTVLPLMPVMLTVPPEQVIAMSTPYAFAMRGADDGWTPTGILLVAWASWSGAYAIRVVAALFAVRRARARFRVFPEMVKARLLHWTQVSGRGRRASLVVADDVPSAAVLACGAPVIAVAPALLQHLSDDELDRIVIHEWAHVQRRDDITNSVQAAVTLLVGWHPAVWWINRRIGLEREVACDEAVVAITGCPKRYAASLLHLADLRSSRRRAVPALGVLSARTLAERIPRLVSSKPVESPIRCKVMCAAAVVALGLSSWAVTALQIRGADVSASFDAAAGVASLSVGPLYSIPDPPQDNAIGRVPRSAGTSKKSARFPTRQANPAHASVETIAEPVETRDVSALDVSSLGVHSVGQGSSPADRSSVRDAASPSDSSEATPPGSSVGQGFSPADRSSVRPWSAAVTAGVAVGNGSKKAGVATAGFFSRFGQRVAGSF